MDPPPPAALPDEIFEEVLIRIPPDDPASLVRAALACKRWCRLISGPSFRRRFRELHPAPPMLGYFYHSEEDTKFVPTSSFRPPPAVRDDWRVLDARHGRVLVLGEFRMSCTHMETEFIVWDPVTNGQQRLPLLRFRPGAWSVALLCATAGCDHLDCRSGPFLVVVVATVPGFSAQRETSAYVYSSVQGAWSVPACVYHSSDVVMRGHRALVGNALYFNYELNTRILEYELGRQELSIIDLPSEFYGWHIVLMEAEDGELGFATVQDSKLCLWSREAGPNGYAGWAQRRVIELDKLLPISDCSHSVSPYIMYGVAHPPYVVAVADSVGVIFVWTDNGLFTVYLKSGRGRAEKIGEYISNFGVVPYTSFCTPALSLASMGDEGSREDASSAPKT